MATEKIHPLIESYAANCIIHTRVNNGMDCPEYGTIDRFNARAMLNDPYRGGVNPILSTISSFRKNPKLLDRDPEPELDAYRTTLQLAEPVELDTLAQAFDDMQEPGIAETHTPVMPGSSQYYESVPSHSSEQPRVASDDLIERLALAFKKS